MGLQNHGFQERFNDLDDLGYSCLSKPPYIINHVFHNIIIFQQADSLLWKIDTLDSVNHPWMGCSPQVGSHR